jgi:hypothetical protein
MANAPIILAVAFEWEGRGMQNEAREALTRMSEDELIDMILQLGRYALRESNRLRWRTGDSVELPGGETVDSIVSLALEKALSGDRRWNPKSQPNIQEYLMDVIDSLLNHLATGKDNRLFVTTSSATIDSDEAGQTSSSQSQIESDWLARSGLSPEEAASKNEEEKLHERAIELLLASSQGDPVLVQVIEAMLLGNDKADRIASATGLNIREVYNAMKRLDRKAARVSIQMNQLLTTGAH